MCRQSWYALKSVSVQNFPFTSFVTLIKPGTPVIAVLTSCVRGDGFTKALIWSELWCRDRNSNLACWIHFPGWQKSCHSKISGEMHHLCSHPLFRFLKGINQSMLNAQFFFCIFSGMHLFHMHSHVSRYFAKLPLRCYLMQGKQYLTSIALLPKVIPQVSC